VIATHPNVGQTVGSPRKKKDKQTNKQTNEETNKQANKQSLTQPLMPGISLYLHEELHDLGSPTTCDMTC